MITVNNQTPRINASTFYEPFYGHLSIQLRKLITFLKEEDNENRIIYLAGDSTLDNKFWVKKYHPAINSYENIMRPAIMKGDFCYYLNKELANRGLNKYKVVNTAREASALADKNILCEQDKVIRDNITSKDILVVSIGGNDFALAPSLSIMSKLFLLNFCNRTNTIENNPESAWGFSGIAEMFKTETTNYIKKLISKNKPSKIVICMLYYPDVNSVPSWCGFFLGLSGYSLYPKQLQVIIKQIYYKAIKEIKIEGVEVKYFPMFKHLDCTDSSNYEGRVEPSEIGTERMSVVLVDKIIDKVVNN